MSSTQRSTPTSKDQSENMPPARRGPRSVVERGFIRLVATGGIIAIGVALGAILSSNNVSGWIIGLVVAGVSVLLAALLWSSRMLQRPPGRSRRRSPTSN